MKGLSKKIFVSMFILLTMLLVSSSVFAASTMMAREGDQWSQHDYMIGAIRENKTDYKANLVKSITILDTNVVPNDAIDNWDVSANCDGSVRAWIKSNVTDADFYDLYIGGEEGININNAYYLFANYTNCISITGLTNLDTSNVTNMKRMFEFCENLTNLDLSKFNTNNVTNMEGMFESCEKLTKLDLSKFNTSNVTFMSNMFNCCYRLKELNISSFDTKNVISMDGMFNGCEGLTSLDLSNFITSNVESMEFMFGGCYFLTNLNLSSFNTGKVTRMDGMFNGCNKLTAINLSGFNTSNVTNMSIMFQGCESLTNLNLNNFNTGNVTSMVSMFNGCNNLIELNISNFDTGNVTDMTYMFYDCSSLTSLDLSGFDTSKATNMSNMFRNCSSLTSLDLSNFNTSNVSDMSNMFYYCSKITSLDLSSFNTKNVTNMELMFYSCFKLSNLDISSFDTSNVTNMKGMFYSCAGLTNLDLSSFDTRNVADMSNMFYYCSNLTSLNLSNFDTSNVTSMLEMFALCSNLTSLDLSGFDTINVQDMESMFSLNNLKSIIMRNPITSSTQAMKLTTDISLGDSAILYVPDVTSKAAYEQATNYDTIFGSDRIKLLLEVDKLEFVPLNKELYCHYKVAGFFDEEKSYYIDLGYTLTVTGWDTTTLGEKEVKYTLTYKNPSDASAQPIVVATTSQIIRVVIPTLNKPTISGDYIYNGTEQTVVLDNFISEMEGISNNKRTNAGTQQVTVNLLYKEATTWEDGVSTDDVVLDWTIQKATPEITLNNLKQDISDLTDVTYEITPAITDGNIVVEYEIEGKYTTTLPTKAGIYNVRVVLTEDTNLNDTTKDGVLTVTKKVTKPTLSGTYTYNGSEQVAVLNNFDEDAMTVSNDKRTDAGSQDIIVTLKDTTYYSWADDTTDAVTIPFNILPKSITLNGAVATNRSYENGNVSVEISAVTFNEAEPTPVLGTGFTVVGEMEDDNAGNEKTVTATVSLLDTNYSLEINEITTKVDIAKVEISANVDSIEAKTFDDTNSVLSENVVVTITGATLSESTEYEVTAVLEDKYVGTEKAVTVTIELKGDALTNYTFANNQTSLEITDKKMEIKEVVTTLVGNPTNVTDSENTPITLIKGKSIDLATIVNLTPDAYKNELTFELIGIPEGITLTGTTLSSDETALVETIGINVTFAGKDLNSDLTNEYKNVSETIYVKITDKEELTIDGLTYSDKSYDGTVVTPTGILTITDNKVAVEDLEVKYEKYNTTTEAWEIITELSKDVGEYRVTYSVPSTNTDYIGTKVYEFKIEKVTPEIQISNLSQKVGSVTNVTYTVTPDVTDGTKKLEYKVSISGDEIYTETLPTEIGTYEVRVIVSGDTNLNNTEKIDTLTITKKSSSGGGGGSSVTKYKITVNQTEGGVISPETVSVKKNENKTFEIKADDGYVIKDVLVDGESVGVITTYTFENVKEKHTITANFEKKENNGNTEKEENWVNPFTDVSENDWFYEAVKFANENKLFNGVSSNEFGTKTNMTRGMIVTVLYRYANAETTKKATFDDVKEDSYYSNAIAWAAENKIVNGKGNNNFAPDASVTREDFVVILYRYAVYAGMDVSVGENTNILSYDDFNQLSEYAIPAMQWACGSGIITGRTASTLAPKGTATRAEVATMIMRFCK